MSITPEQLKKAEELAKEQGGLTIVPGTPGGVADAMAQCQDTVKAQACFLPKHLAAALYGNKAAIKGEKVKVTLGVPPAGTSIDDETTYVAPKKDFQVGFYAYEKIAGVPEDLVPLAKKLTASDDIDEYADASNGAWYHKPDEASLGYTSTKILPELTGIPLCNLVLAYCHAFKPSSIRVSKDGCVCTDALADRITIFLDDDGKVERITQEISILYGCGADVGSVLDAVKAGKEPPKTSSSGCIGHTAGLAKADFG